MKHGKVTKVGGDTNVMNCSWPMDAGRVPLNWLAVTSRIVSEVSAPSESGSVPDKSFLSKCRMLRNHVVTNVHAQVYNGNTHAHDVLQVD